ncbi:MAG: HPr family phosphocarrier protein [Acidobacteriota bacterium]|nr:HPr family phosphocarrier protein [Acidobacteriota bacterium]
MRSFVHAIVDPLGFHARSCVTIAREASRWASAVIVRDAEREADGKSMASLLALRARRGDVLSVTCKGPDEAEAASAIEALMRMSL